MKNRAQIKILSPQETLKSRHHETIVKSKIKGNAAYSLDWAFIFSSMDQYIKKYKKNQCVILDVGCGNSMFHLFLEDYFGQGIIGIDREDATLLKAKYIKMGHQVTNANDLSMDFIKDGNKFFNNNVDIVYWNSSIEHNSMEGMQKALKVSLKALKKGGIFLATWPMSKKTYWNKSAVATILSPKDASKVFKGDWIVEPDFEGIAQQYKKDILGLNTWHKKRFGHENYEYFHAGCSIIKQ